MQVALLRENVTLRRVGVIVGNPMSSVVNGYMHNDVSLSEEVTGSLAPIMESQSISLGRTASVVSLNSGGNKAEAVSTLAYKLAMQSVASKPLYVSRSAGESSLRPYLAISLMSLISCSGPCTTMHYCELRQDTQVHNFSFLYVINHYSARPCCA